MLFESWLFADTLLLRTLVVRVGREREGGGRGVDRYTHWRWRSLGGGRGLSSPIHEWVLDAGDLPGMPVHSTWPSEGS